MWDDCEELSEAFDDSTSGHEQRDLDSRHHSPPMYALLKWLHALSYSFVSKKASSFTDSTE